MLPFDTFLPGLPPFSSNELRFLLRVSFLASFLGFSRRPDSSILLPRHAVADPAHLPHLPLSHVLPLPRVDGEFPQ